MIVFSAWESLRIRSDEQCSPGTKNSGELQRGGSVASIQRKMLEYVERYDEIGTAIADGQCKHTCLLDRQSSRPRHDKAFQRQVEPGDNPIRMRLEKP